MPGCPPRGGLEGAPDVLRRYTAEDHRRRLLNIAFCEQRIRTCMRRHLITNYLPGQAYYNLCEYPCRTWSPDERDEQELDRLRDHGIGLIQLHEEWNDAARRFGGDKFTPADPEGLRRFVDMAHRRGIRVIVYISTGYFEQRDPDFRKEWARENDTLAALWFRYARCSPASAGWRAYLLPRITRILDEYGVDGLYNDVGYHPLYKRTWAGPPTKDEVPAFEEGPGRDGAFLDLLALIYDEVKRRGGLVKVHARNVHFDRARPCYDYQWVGEGAANADALRETSKDFPPFVVPCLDLRFAAPESEDLFYLETIPYMQFPLLLAGRPFTGERARCPGMEYAVQDDGEEDCSTRMARQMWDHAQAHPQGPHCHGWWDSCPPAPERRTTHARWLKEYLPLVEAGTWAWLEVGDSTLFAAPLPAGVVASAYANRELHLVLANYTHAPLDVTTTDAYAESNSPSGPPARQWRLAPRSLTLLKRTERLRESSVPETSPCPNRMTPS